MGADGGFKGRTFVRVVLVATALAALLTFGFVGIAAADPPTTITFEGSAPATGASVTNQYAGQGLSFVVDGTRGFDAPILTDLSTQSPPIAAVSGTRAIQLDGAAEFPNEKLEGAFQGSTRTTVSMWVRAGNGAAGATQSFTLTALRGTATIGAPDTASLSATGWTQLSVTLPSAQMTGFTLTRNSNTSQGPFYVDDIFFDNPAPGTVPPDFTLSAPLQTSLEQGQTGTSTISISRFNGSGGTIGFTTSGAPTGTNVSVVPASATPATNAVTATFQVAQTTAPGTYPIHITPTYDSTAGDIGSDHSVTINLTVTPSCGDPNYGRILHLSALNGGCFHPNGDNTFTYIGDTLRLNGIVAHVTDFRVDESAHRLTAVLFTVDTGSNVAGGSPGIPIYAGPLNATVPSISSDSVPLVDVSSDGLSNLLKPFAAGNDSSQPCDSSGSGSGTSSGSGSSRDSRSRLKFHTNDDNSSCSPGSVTDMINLTGSGAEAPLELKLPGALGGLTADVTLKWKNTTGFDSDFGYKFKLPQVPLGPLVLGPLELDHTGDGVWSGTVGVKVPDPVGVGLAGTFGWDHGGLRQLSVSVTGLHVPFVAGTFLTEAHLGFRQFSSGPFTYGFNGGLGFQWGPQVSGHALAEIDGTLEFDFGNLNTPRPGPSGGTYWPFNIVVGAHLKLAGIDVGNGSVTIAQDAQGFTFRVAAEVGVGLPYVAGQDPADADVSLSGHLLGWIQPPNFDAQASVALKVWHLDIAGADLLVSSQGWGACVHILFFSGGFGQHWGHSVDIMGPFGCDISSYAPEYRNQGSGSAVGTSHTLSFPNNSKPVFLKLIGSQGPPKVTLTGPGGRKLTVPVSSAAPIKNHNFVVLQSVQQKLTFIAINHPGGKWKLTPEAASSPIVQTLGAKTMPTPKVTAHVAGTGERRVLHYTLKPRPHQTVQFAEIGTRTHRFIGIARGHAGAIHFTPDQAGPGGKRQIEALVSIGGVPQKQFVVATFKAPNPPKPSDARSVKVTHTAAGSVIVAWKPGTLVSAYRVQVTLSDGIVRFEQVGAKVHRAVFSGIPTTLTATATVQVQHLNGGIGKLVGPSRSKKPGKGGKR